MIGKQTVALDTNFLKKISNFLELRSAFLPDKAPKKVIGKKTNSKSEGWSMSRSLWTYIRW
jgi:hypothetical protein